MVLRHCALTEEPKDDNPCWDISIKWSDWWWEWTSTICWMKTRFLWYLSRSSLAVPFSLELALKVKWSSMMIRLPLLKGHLFFSGRRSRDVSDGEDDDFVRSMSAFDACWKSSNTFGSSSLFIKTEREARGEFMILPVVFVFIKEAEGVASFMLLLFIFFSHLFFFFLRLSCWEIGARVPEMTPTAWCLYRSIIFFFALVSWLFPLQFRQRPLPLRVSVFFLEPKIFSLSFLCHSRIKNFLFFL